MFSQIHVGPSHGLAVGMRVVAVKQDPDVVRRGPHQHMVLPGPGVVPAKNGIYI
jgi:hypothetical protein